jgi:MFS transporter, DHA1 family, multidrug resistance protein
VLWRRNLFAVTAISFIGFMGFTLVMPFLPLYFQQLGVQDVGDIALWSGLSLGVTPALTACLSPFWGRLADRFGRKIMVERSLASFVLIFTAMAYVTSPWHVFLLRAVQGLFAGYGSLAVTMAADSAPRDRMATSIGTVQTAQRLGPALGPVVGGTVAHVVGLRHAFLVTACFYGVALVLVFLMYDERGVRHQIASDGRGQVTFRNVLAFENFVLLIVVVFGLQFADRSFGPVLPLFIAQLGIVSERVPIVSGSLFSIGAGTGALGHHLCGHLLRRTTPRVLIGWSSAVAAVCTIAYAAAGGVVLLIPATAFFGLAIGCATTAAFAAAGSVIPTSARGTGFGLLTTGNLVGLALSPIICGFLGAVSIRSVFLLDAVSLTALAIAVHRIMVAAPVSEAPAPRPAEEI